MLGSILYLIPLLPLVAISPSRTMVWPDAAPVLLQQRAAAQLDSEDAVDDAAKRELKVFHAAKVSLLRAIAIAENLHMGSSAADVTFDSSSGSAVYRVRTTKKARIWESAVDGSSGKVTEHETVLSLSNLSNDERNNFLALTGARQKLADAVLIAERATDGKAIGASLMRKDDRLHFLVLIVSGDHLKEVILKPPGPMHP